jgi:hypothetical protein
MKRFLLFCLLCLVAAGASAKQLTYNESTIINMRDAAGIPADERAMNVLAADGDFVYGATSGDACHVFRFNAKTDEVTLMATIPGTNTVMRGLVVDGDVVYLGTMWTKRQRWLKVRPNDPTYDPEDANLLPVKDEYHTGQLYRIKDGAVEDLGVMVPNQGIHTMTLDKKRGLIYGVTAPKGRFFIYDTKTGTMEHTAFGITYSMVSNHRVGLVTVDRELADLLPGEAEWNNRLIAKAMFVASDGMMYTSGWEGQILRYDPAVTDIQQRFSVVGYIPSAPGRHYWNRLDAIVEKDGALFMGTSDGYIIKLDLATDEMTNLVKPFRAIDVKGMAFSPLDGRLYGVSGGGVEGMSRPWSCDVNTGSFEIDYPALQVFVNRHEVGDVACAANGVIVASEANRVGNLWLLKPGEAVSWEKSGMLEELQTGEGRVKIQPEGRFKLRKPLEVEVYPIPSTMHGGSGYTAIEQDRDGKVYVGTAYYGQSAFLTQLDPKTAAWRAVFRSDELTGQYGRGQGIPGKIHTKLRLGEDGKIYGAMKQGYESHYRIRADIGEAPEGFRGSQFTCHLFSYDPATDTALDLGPSLPQEGVTSFDVDTARGYLYGATVPGVSFIVYNQRTKRLWNAGAMAHGHPKRYMPSDPETGKVYHCGETTPSGKNYMTVWYPDEFRLRDLEIVPEDGFEYRHSYASACGAAGTKTYYGLSGGQVFEMDLNESKDGKLHARPICYAGVDGDEQHSGAQAFERGPDGRIYWGTAAGRNVPLDIFVWDPKTKKKSYLGSCATGGEYIKWSHLQGMSFDDEGNLAMHILYAELSPEQRKHWKAPDDFYYEDTEPRDHYLDYPSHDKGTYYSVYYVKNATSLK